MTPRSQRSTVVGVFRDRDNARQAIEALKDTGFAADSISVLAPDKGETHTLAQETGTHAGSGAATGLVAGGILGGLGGWLVGIGALAIPGVGPFIAAGAFASALGGAAIGAGVGAIAGALVGMGVPKEEAEYYEGEARSGRTLVTVRAGGRYEEAQRTLREHGAYDIESRDALSTPAVTGIVSGQTVSGPAVSSRDAESNRTMQLREEELHARKTPVETGEVTLGKDVVEERKTLDVPVTREEVYVERKPADRPTDRPIDADERNTAVEVPVREERVEVDKQPVVYEEVSVGKQRVVENRPVSDTVRREELRVDREGDVNVGGAPSAGTATRGRTWAEAMPTYRQQWQQRYGATGSRWEDYEPGYRYGHERRGQPAYQGRSWTEVEPQFESDWTRRNPGTPWARVRDSVRETWDSDPDV